MLTYDISERGNLTIYEYLYRCIKADIIKGRLSLGEKLPSKREDGAAASDQPENGRERL